MKKTNNVLKFLAMTFVLLVFMSVSAFAAYPSHTDYISDDATVLADAKEAQIKEKSEELYERIGARIAVCTVLTTGDKGIEKYASELFTEWNVGHGVLIVMAVEDNTYYFIQSKTVSKALNGTELGKIVSATFEPRYDEKNYSEAAYNAADALYTFLIENIKEPLSEKASMPVWLIVIIVLIVIVVVVIVGGYILLIYLEKKRAAQIRARREMQRRRQMSGAVPVRRNAPPANRNVPPARRNAPPAERRPDGRYVRGGYNPDGRPVGRGQNPQNRPNGR